jgi:hypothetical protein
MNAPGHIHRWAVLWGMRALASLIILALVWLGGDAQATPMGTHEYDRDRPGHDLMPGFASSHESTCSTSCATNDKCVAYTYIKPNTPGGDGACWLKGRVPKAVENPRGTSGVRIMGPQEVNMDRPGDNIGPGFPVKFLMDCEARCKSEPECVAYTFVKPGIQGPGPQCWLKRAKPGKQGNDCCISGVKIQAPVRVGAPGNLQTSPR